MEKTKILVIRLSSIGDIIQALAVPRLLLGKFPDAQIHWVVRSDNFELLQHNPYVTKIFSFDRNLGFRGWLALCREIRLENYTHVYDAHGKMRSRILCWYLKLQSIKTGNPSLFIRRSKERFRRFLLFYFKIHSVQKYWNGIDTYIEPLKAWGIINDHKGSELFLQKVPATFLSRPASFFETSEAEIIAIAPATAWPKKTWPLDHWKELLKILLEKTDYNFLVLGGPKDDFCNDLVTISPKRIVSMQGKLKLLESAAAITFCKTLIAGDTGLLHMAEALGKDVIGINGPTHLGHTYRPGSVTLKTKLWCQPCTKDGSGICINPTYQKCMKDVLPQEVSAKVL